jgi:transposase-like protein
MDAETKARALADLRAGCGVRETARKYDVDHTAILKWRDADASMIATVSPEQQQARFDIAIKVTQYINEALDTLIAHLQLARDPAWFGQQDAQGLAVFDGVHHDKLVRTLAALQRAAAAAGLAGGADGDGDSAAGPGDEAGA